MDFKGMRRNNWAAGEMRYKNALVVMLIKL